MLDGAATLTMLRAGAARVIENERALTRADQTIGDGDHGVGMARGFRSALAALDGLDRGAGPGSAFSAVGKAVLMNAGGASGAVFGTFFTAVGKALAGAEVDTRALAAAFGDGARAVIARGKARAGDKTMLDALLPAIEAFDGAGPGEDLAGAMAAAAAAARNGMEATANMVARTGRAKTLGPRSLGHVDPGALSMTLLFEGMASVVAGEEKTL